MGPDWRKDYVRYRTLFHNLVAQYRGRSDLKAYLEVLLSLVTISIFIAFALRPTLITIAQLLKDIDAKKQIVVKMDSKIQNLAQARSAYDAEKANILLLENAIPKQATPALFARQIERLIGTHPVTVISIVEGKGTILGAKTKDTAEEEQSILPQGTSGTDFSISLSPQVNNYQMLAAFLSDFEKLRIFPVIDGILITKGQEKDGRTITMFIRGEMPYLLYTKENNL